MKKLKLLMLMVVMICGSISATCQSSQTTTIETQWLRNAAKLIEKGKIDAERVKLLNQQVAFLNQRIAIKDSIIAAHVVKDSAQEKVVETHLAERDNLVSQRDAAVNEMKHQNKALRRQKRKTVFVAVAGPVVTAAIFLLIKK